MTLTRRSSSGPFPLILGCLMALVTAPLAMAQATVSLSDGASDSTDYSLLNAPDVLTMNINSGTATYTGLIGGQGSVVKTGAGTLIWTNSSGYLGSTTVQAGVLEIASGALITNTNNLYAGNAAGESGTLQLNGGIMAPGIAHLGGAAGGTGTVAVTSGSFNPGILYAGEYGTGVVNLSGGSALATLAYVGMYSGAKGAVNVSGGTWNGSSLSIGHEGTGVVNVSSGSMAINSLTSLGSAAAATGNGTLNVSGGSFTSSSFKVGEYGTGVFNLSSGTVTTTNSLTEVGSNQGATGTVNVSGGTWNVGNLLVGLNGLGVMNVTGGNVVVTSSASVGAGGLGYGATVNMSGGTWSGGNLMIGGNTQGTFNLSGGTLSSQNVNVGFLNGASGTMNVSGGTWTVNGDFLLGAGSAGALNVTGSGVVNAGATGQGTLYLASDTFGVGTLGTLNMGTGGLAGTLNAGLVSSGPGAAFVNFNHTNDIVFNAELTGSLSVTKSGSGTTALTAANTYTGATVINGGTLELAFGTVPSSILLGSTDITMSNGTLKISNSSSGFSFQTLNNVAVQPYSAATLVMGANTLLELSGVAYLGTQSALYIDAEAGGVIGPATGTSHIFVDSLPDGPLAPTVTMKDAGGFGLAEIFGGQVVRATDTLLLPSTGSDADTNYLINNNSGGPSAAGSSSLVLEASSETASITVDTTAGVGSLTIGAGSTLYSNVWNFGGLGNNAYSIIAGDSGSALSASLDGNIQINNFNAAPVSISAPITANGTNELIIEGTGKIIFTSTSSITGNTSLVGGTLVLENGGTLNSYNSGTLTVGMTAGGQAVLDVKQGNVQMHYITIASDSYSTGSMHVAKDQNVSVYYDMVVGQYGNARLDIDGGTVISDAGRIAAYSGSTGTVLIQNGGAWRMSGDLDIGSSQTGGNGVGTLTLVTGGYMDLREGSGNVTLGANSTINYGLGGSAGRLGASSITATDASAVVNFNFSTDDGDMDFYSQLGGSLSVNKMGSGTVNFARSHTYSGSTTVNGGTLALRFFEVTTNMLSPSSTLVLGGGTLMISGPGTQTMNGLTTTASTGSAILLLGGNETLDLGALTMGAHSALNFNIAAGENGPSGSISSIILSGQTVGAVISNSFTVQDSTGFGLATVNEEGQVARITNTPLLPVSGASASVDYLIDNNGGGYSAAGSSQMMIGTSESARSITVDTTTASGIMSLDPDVVVGADVWNFGGNVADNNYFIIPGAFAYGTGVGIQPTTAGGVMQINNYSTGFVYIGAPILDNDGSGLLITGTGRTILGGHNTYTGTTTVNSGTLIINSDQSGATGATLVQTGGALGGGGILGTAIIGGDIQVQAGGTLTPGAYLFNGSYTGTLSGSTATFQSGSVFSLHGSGADLPTLHLTGAVSIAAGAYFSLVLDSDLTASSYTLLTAESGLDGSAPFTLMYPEMIPEGYKLVYTGTALQLNISAPAVAYWTGAVSNKWSALGDGSSNWATTVDGTTDTHSIPAALTDVYFAANNAASTDTVLDTDFTVNSLTVNTDTSISRDVDPHTLTVAGATTVNAQLAVNFGVTLSAASDLTVSGTGTLAGDGTVQMAADRSMYIYGAIGVGNPNPEEFSGAQLTLTTSGTGAIVMGSSSVILVDLFSGAGEGNNTAPFLSGSADQLNLHGKLDATGGGTLVVQNPNSLTAFAGGDQWQLINLNAGNDPGSIVGQLAVDDSSLGLAAGLVGRFDQSTGIYSIVDYRGELSAIYSGLPMANAMMQGVIAAAQTATTDLNGHLFNLRSGGGEEEDEGDGSISASLDYGVVEGQGDGPESPMARRVRASRQWQVFTTVNYGNVRLNPISSQAGVQVDSWASSVGIERHLSRGLTLGFAATFLQSTQNYTSGLGSMHLEGPTLSTYLAYARKGVWASLMYSFGDYDLGSFRNPGFGMPVANGATTAYVNSVQFNTGYNFRFQNNTFVTGPFVGIDYLHGSVDGYTETGGGAGALAFGKQSFESLVTRVGWSASKRLHTNWAEITPQVRVSYERQNIHNNGTSVQSLTIPFSTTGGNQNPGQDYMVLGGGVNFQITPELSVLLNYQTQIFRDNMTSHFGSIRLGYKF